MKKHITKLIGIALVAFYLLGCDDDELQPQDPGQTGISVQFEKKQDEHLEEVTNWSSLHSAGSKPVLEQLPWRLTHLQSVLRIPVRRTRW